MKLYQIKIECKPSQLDTVCAVVTVYEPNMVIDDASDVIEFNPVYGELIDEELLKRRDEASVSVYFEDEEYALGIQKSITEHLESIGEKTEITFAELDDVDYMNNWKQYYKPVEIGKKLVIVPQWEEYTLEEGQVEVIMDPGMAFGTGTHESTQLCAELMEKYMPGNAVVLDVGTGSGILAIAAVKLGAKCANGYDIDADAVAIAAENAELNGVGQSVHFAQSDLLASVNGIYNFVTANITAEILIRMSKDIARFMTAGAYLAVSGVLDRQRDEVVAAMEKGGLKLADESHKNDWSGLLFQK